MQRTFFHLNCTGSPQCVPLFYDMNEVNFTTRILLGKVRETLYLLLQDCLNVS